MTLFSFVKTEGRLFVPLSKGNDDFLFPCGEGRDEFLRLCGEDKDHLLLPNCGERRGHFLPTVEKEGTISFSIREDELQLDHGGREPSAPLLRKTRTFCIPFSLGDEKEVGILFLYGGGDLYFS